MAKGKSSSGRGEAQYTITQINLDKKGKTNKKVSRNPNAAKNLSVKGKELREQAAAFAKEHFKKGRRTALKLKRAEEAKKKEEEHKKKKELAKAREQSGYKKPFKKDKVK